MVSNIGKYSVIMAKLRWVQILHKCPILSVLTVPSSRVTCGRASVTCQWARRRLPSGPTRLRCSWIPRAPQHRERSVTRRLQVAGDYGKEGDGLYLNSNGRVVDLCGRLSTGRERS